MMLSKLRVGACLSALTLCIGCSPLHHTVTDPVEDTEPYRFKVIEQIVFSPDHWPQPLQADLYLPNSSSHLPIVLMVHGGGWSGRDRSDMQTTAKKLAKHGYAVFNVSYRFAPEFTYPAQLHDLQLALLWLQNNAQKYQLDMARLNGWGYSSGAHLIAQLASVSPGQAQSLVLSEELPTLRAVVAGGIPADLSQYSGSPIVIPFLGADLHEDPDLYRQASPINHISGRTPPTFLYHGKYDFLVEKEQSINYYQSLLDKGIVAELYLHPLWGHFAMFLLGGGAESKGLEFLNQHNIEAGKSSSLSTRSVSFKPPE